MVSTTTIAELGALVGDPGRANMLIALLDGRALTARELADRAGVTPQTASGHLGRLLTANLIRVEQQGRHRYHRLASSDVADLLEAMHIAGARLEARADAKRPGPVDPALRAARSCYDHIAGELGVALADALAGSGNAGSGNAGSGNAGSRNDGSGGESGLALSASGERRLADWGIDLDRLRGMRRPFCRACLDWSERRSHLAGTVGAAILDRSLTLGWLRRRHGSRALIITHAGETGFRSVFDTACVMTGNAVK
ncbi:MAG: helix-turn-helix domain-containing protein [Pseudomonadota bacterium]|nr:helix-turn-helix domain-containing protein [Pseudomonadota bacterium]